METTLSMTEQVWLMLGPVGATMAILIFAMQKVLKNQSDANQAQMKAQAELNTNMIDRMDRLVQGIPESNAHIEGVITNQLTASEGRIVTKIEANNDALNKLARQCAVTQASRIEQ